MKAAAKDKLKNVRRENLRLRRGLTVIGDILYAPGGACGPRIQHDYQLVVIHKGSLNLKLDEENIHVGEGQGILLSPGHREYFSFSSDQETQHSWCAIHPRALPHQVKSHLRACKGPIPFAGRMHTLLEMSRRPHLVLIPEEALQAGFYLGLGMALLCDFSSAVKEGRVSNGAAEAVLAKLEKLIWNELASPLSLYDIARGVGVSRQHLLKVCRVNNKPTPMTQLYAARLEAATDLLRRTELPIDIVAEKCGFVSRFHFSRRFKQAYGESPAAWRRLADIGTAAAISLCPFRSSRAALLKTTTCLPRGAVFDSGPWSGE